MEISGPRIGLRAMQLETVIAHVSQQLITCGRARKHLTVRPEVGAVCEKDACPDLCGGREVTCVPTATVLHAKPRVGLAADGQVSEREQGVGAHLDYAELVMGLIRLAAILIVLTATWTFICCGRRL